MFRLVLVVTTWALCAAPAPALDSGSVTECMARNVPKKTSLQTIEMRARDRIGAERSIRGKIYWKRFDDGFSRVLAKFSAPVDIDGARLLMIGKKNRNDIFLYMPAVKKVRRINSQTVRGNIFGTDFSYEDFERLQGMSGEVKAERMPDADLDGRPVYVLVSRPPPDSGSAYEKAVSYVDQETCVPLKVELFEGGERLRKVLSSDPDKIARADGLWLPREVLMRDLRDQTETRLVIDEIEVGAKIPDRCFSTTALERSRDC
jgi:hypothetical protein